MIFNVIINMDAKVYVIKTISINMCKNDIQH